jgi:RNA polymerase sigma-70 factor (ECF subfamily)
LIRRARADGTAHASWDQLITLYWKPVYWFIRSQWRRSNEDAKDATQEFFAVLLERQVLADLHDEHGRFRTFLRACLKNFLLSDHRDKNRLKRGGGVAIVALEEAPPIPAEGLTPEEAFDRAWAHALLNDSIAALREVYLSSGREVHWKVFERCELAPAPLTYEACASELGLKRDDVHNRLRHARKTLRGLVRERVRDTLADSADLRDELASLERANDREGSA